MAELVTALLAPWDDAKVKEVMGPKTDSMEIEESKTNLEDLKSEYEMYNGAFDPNADDEEFDDEELEG
eukprot:GDKH01029134.1.p4 GENE.GDKH01029134.1~~GDKH01029134.1.p4  ORF type:complete len:68 (-),score=23.51 GDKH01029134.1:569-772(-)